MCENRASNVHECQPSVYSTCTLCSWTSSANEIFSLGIKSWGLQSPVDLCNWVMVVFSKPFMVLQVLLQSTLSDAVAYCRIHECSLPTLALSSACLAAASDKLPTCFCCLLEGCPADVPASVTLRPPLFARGRKLCSRNSHLPQQ